MPDSGGTALWQPALRHFAGMLRTLAGALDRLVAPVEKDGHDDSPRAGAGGPPAHWLELVAERAPELLSPRTGETPVGPAAGMPHHMPRQRPKKAEHTTAALRGIQETVAEPPVLTPAKPEQTNLPPLKPSGRPTANTPAARPRLADSIAQPEEATPEAPRTQDPFRLRFEPADGRHTATKRIGARAADEHGPPPAQPDNPISTQAHLTPKDPAWIAEEDRPQRVGVRPDRETPRPANVFAQPASRSETEPEISEHRPAHANYWPSLPASPQRPDSARMGNLRSRNWIEKLEKEQRG